MKKIIIFTFFIFLLSSCYTKNSEIIKNNINKINNEYETNKEKNETIEKDKENEIEKQEIEMGSENISNTKKESNDITNKWKTYNNDNLDIIFNYPEILNITKTEFNDNNFQLTLTNNNYKLYIYGRKNDFYITDSGPYINPCAYQYESIEDFCKDSCEKLNNNLAIDYRVIRYGEIGYRGIAYTNLSEKYPSLCFEFDLEEVFFSEIPYEERSKYENYDIIKTKLKNREFSDSFIKKVDDFIKFVKTIKIKDPLTSF